jgi:hypothetical protein
MSRPLGPIRPVGSGTPPVPALAATGRRRPRDEDAPREREPREGDERPDTPAGPDADGHVDVLA